MTVSDRRPTPAGWLRRHVRRRPIPFGAERRRQTAAYSLRHYGRAEWRLRQPKLIVIHYAVLERLDGIRALFVAGGEHNGEPPATCAHFAVGDGGRIVQMVDTAIRCRHVIGLNDVAIGIEHTGFSDEEVLARRRQMRASLGLAQALRCAYRLPVAAVIGHNESPASPWYHRDDPHADLELHGDFGAAAMSRYRDRLTALGPCRRTLRTGATPGSPRR